MSQPRKTKASVCKQHIVSLKAPKEHKSKRSINLLLCQQSICNGSTCSQPVFNNDSKYYTPAFIVSNCPGNKSDEKMRKDHEKKLNDYLETKSVILLPRPGKSSYCGVCKDDYVDYKQHIQTIDHKRALVKSKYNKHILDFCNTYKVQQTKIQKDQNKKQEPQPSLRKVRKTDTPQRKTLQLKLSSDKSSRSNSSSLLKIQPSAIDMLVKNAQTLINYPQLTLTKSNNTTSVGQHSSIDTPIIIPTLHRMSEQQELIQIDST